MDLNELQEIMSNAEDSRHQFKPDVSNAASLQVNENILKLLRVINGEMKRTKLHSCIDLKHENYFCGTYLSPALEKDYIEMTRPRNTKKSFSEIPAYSQTDLNTETGKF